MLVKPRSRSRCAEGAGLEEHHQPNDNQRRSSAFSGVLISLLLSAISTMIKSKAGAPSYVRLTPQPTHIRSGLAHTKVPHALLRGRRAPRRMGPILTLGISQPSPATVTHPPWIAVFLHVSFSRLSFQLRASRDHAGLQVAPQSNQELARHGDDRDAARSALEIADACLEPAAERAVGLIAQPSPGEFDHHRARLGIAGLADALVAIERPAAKWA